jgi:mRNA interferase HigB
MKIVSKKALRDFWIKYPLSQEPLEIWYRIVSKTDFRNFSELRETFPSADKVGKFCVFNIGGNKFRLIAAIHFNRQRIYIRSVLTHVEYDRGAWKRE